jgi:DNA-directed RNA polymerase alpha subunit
LKKLEKYSIICLGVVVMLEILDKDIEILKLNIDIVKILKKNKIIKVKQLANKTKTKLKDIGLLGYQISEIEIKLQLEGLDLKGNY